MPIDDEQLDELLRDVSVPHDLKASLLQIPDQELNVIHEDSRPRSGSRMAIAGLLAAIAATVLVFMYIPKTPIANHIDDDHSASAERLLAQMQRNVDAMAEIQQTAELEFSSEQLVLEYIINTFPGTRGADEARTILRIN